MKRPIDSKSDPDPTTKKPKPNPDTASASASAVLSDDNLLYEVLKHADARTLAASACVNRLWRVTARDERLWELICTRHPSNLGCPERQLRSVVLALGGFRNLHSLYLVPLSRPVPVPTPSSSSAWPCLPVSGPAPGAGPARTKWGKDEMQLSLSLLSIRYFEKMSFGNREKGI